MLQVFYNDWTNLVRTIIAALLGYPAVVFLLRVSGKRTLSKMNAFDLVVTVALGSLLAATLLGSGTSLAQGILAFAMLVGLQYGVNRLSVHSAWFQRIVKGDPSLLVYDGRFLEDQLKRARVPQAEVLDSVRQAGMESIEQVRAVVLETDGSLSVIRRAGHEAVDTLRDVDAPAEFESS
jgi:uncharacterized membrane protein YcaP (DUF421 family)